jgi:hypothetical protein
MLSVMGWAGGASNRRVLALAVLIAAMPVGGLLVAGPTPLTLLEVLLLAAEVLLGALAMAAVRVTSGPDGLRVGAGPWGWPARTVPAAEIVSARAEVRDAVTLGTWGYHDPAGHTAVMVRGGECLVLELEGGRTFAVAVDGAAAAAGRINARPPAGRR